MIPEYSKLLKDLITKKKSLKDYDIFTVEKDCSTILQNSTKLGDPGSFTIPISIGNLLVGRSLLDLGSSVNLMPLSLLNKIGKVAMKPTRMMIQLADRSIKFPPGIVENMPVRVRRFTIPMDFVIMDIREEVVVPLILGRPFMNTANVVISVAVRKCTL